MRTCSPGCPDTIRKGRLSGKAAAATLVALLPVLFAGGVRADDEPAYTGTTLTGRPIEAPAWPQAVRDRLEQDLDIARAVLAVAPDREESWIWVGRRYGYLGRYPEAIEAFTAGLERFPDSYRLYRFRGRHRARNRDFAGAIADYESGLARMEAVPDAFEPDGMPNALGLPISTYRSNLHYYLGQTSFATGDWERMLVELERSMAKPVELPIDDHRVAVVFWQYLALMKLGRNAEAAALLASLPAEPVLIENDTYHRAVQVLGGETDASSVLADGDSLARFALGMKLGFEGRREESRRVLADVVAANALGYWPAEAELVRP